jgi:protein TonB
LLVELEPRSRVFFSNLASLFRTPPRIPLSSPPGRFWPDVFVASPMPWRRFFESVGYHLLLAAAIWGWTTFLTLRPRPQNSFFENAKLTYYPATDYLPPLDTGRTPVHKPQPGEPEYAKQRIISVPPEADNRTQTIVTPPQVKLTREVALPNLITWTPVPMAVPLAATTRSPNDAELPTYEMTVVAPPPELDRAQENRVHLPQVPVIEPPPDAHAVSQTRGLQAPQPSIIEPPPALDASVRKLGDVNLGPSDVIAPAPQLPMAAQRAGPVAALSAMGGSVPPQVIPPPPSLQGTGSGPAGGQLIALGIHPVEPTGPLEVPQGNRRGTFAATPEGKPGAPGTPEIRASDGESSRGGGNGNGGHGAGSAAAGQVPPGIFVGAGPAEAAPSALAGNSPAAPAPAAAPSQNQVNPNLLAHAAPPRVGDIPRRPAAKLVETVPSEIERRVFGGRQFYSMTLNMPNLNSAGGSWVIRFAELKNAGPGELAAPVATHKVDPAYPADLIRQNVQGTVTLYAVIRSDGTVGEVRVLNGVDDRLDGYARAALLRWNFRPATRNGNAVSLEAVVIIPFKIRLGAF